MARFSLFPKLPPELRSMIWEKVIEILAEPNIHFVSWFPLAEEDDDEETTTESKFAKGAWAAERSTIARELAYGYDHPKLFSAYRCAKALMHTNKEARKAYEDFVRAAEVSSIGGDFHLNLKKDLICLQDNSIRRNLTLSKSTGFAQPAVTLAPRTLAIESRYPSFESVNWNDEDFWHSVITGEPSWRFSVYPMESLPLDTSNLEAVYILDHFISPHRQNVGEGTALPANAIFYGKDSLFYAIDPSNKAHTSAWNISQHTQDHLGLVRDCIALHQGIRDILMKRVATIQPPFRVELLACVREEAKT